MTTRTGALLCLYTVIEAKNIYTCSAPCQNILQKQTRHVICLIPNCTTNERVC